MKSSILFRAIALAVLSIACASPAFAAGAAKEKSLGVFGAWRTFTYDEGGQTVCYMVTTKILKTTGPKKRGLPYLMITHRPIEASTDVVSYGAGALLDAKYGVKINVGKGVFDLFSVRDNAWARDSVTDHKLAAALRAAPAAQVSGLSGQKGAKKIVDQFDLSGAVSAYRAIGKACGLPNNDAPQHAPKKQKSAKAKNAH